MYFSDRYKLLLCAVQLCQVQFGGEEDAPPTSHQIRRSAGDKISLAQLQHTLLEDYGKRSLSFVHLYQFCTPSIM